MADKKLTPFDMCECGWTRVQHCARAPHRCTHPGCYCVAFKLSSEPELDRLDEAIRTTKALARARFFPGLGLRADSIDYFIKCGIEPLEES